MNRYSKKIVVDLTPILPGGVNGGAKVFVIELLKKLIELKSNYFWSFIIRPGLEKELAFLKNKNTKLVSEQNLNKMFEAKRLQKFGRVFIKNNPFLPLGIILLSGKIYRHWIKKKRFKALFLNHYDLLFCPFTAPIYHQKNVPTVSIIYDLQYKTYPSFFSSEDVAGRNATFINACEKATRLIAISEYSRQKAIEHGNLHDEKVQTIHISLAQRFETHIKNKSLLKQHHLKQNEYFIYPANFWRHKNHEFLITAFQIARTQGITKEIKLVLTGAPCERQKILKKMIIKMGLQDKIIFLDYVSNEELAVLMKNSLALVFPSLYEGFGIPLVEAMALEVPVLCSNVTSLPEIGGDAVLMFNPKDPLDMAQKFVEIFKNEDLRNELVEKGKKRRFLFSDLNQMAEEYLMVFDSVFY